MNFHKLFRRALPLLLSAGFFSQALAIKCGTAAYMQEVIRARALGQTPSARTAALLSSRTLLTSHFSIAYTMGRNVHRPRLTVQDSSLKKKADSIYSSLSASLNATQKDQAVNQGLDNLSAPHPLYIQQLALYLERARTYYADSIGMSMPGSICTVQVSDINTLNPGVGAVYGYTYSSNSILMENDFLYNVLMDTAGRVTGTAIKAYVNGQVLHDYSSEWDLGLKVTASHEYYHVVQYVYTPDPGSIFHAWYELSATGMEERLAPEVNDYFQYLPSVLQHHETVSLLDLDIENYGNGIFHQYLTLKFGSRFDRKVWTSLSTNGNNIVGALTSMALTSGSRFDTLYAAYTSALATAGRAGSVATCADSLAPIFTRDLRCWPLPSMDSIPAPGVSVHLPVTVLTFRLLKPAASGKVGLATLSQLSGERRIDKIGADYGTTPLTANTFQIAPSLSGSVLAWDVPNTSFSQNGEIVLVGTTPKYNPVNLSDGQAVFLAPAGSAPPLILTILSESGKRVADLSLSDDQTWTWNLKDLQNRAAPPGVYFYRSPGQPPKTFLILAP